MTTIDLTAGRVSVTRRWPAVLAAFVLALVGSIVGPIVPAAAASGDVLGKGQQYCADTYSAHSHDGRPAAWLVDINFPGDNGAPLYAPGRGAVTSGWGKGPGNFVWWTSSDGVESIYFGHLATVVKTGAVNGGEQIGTIGSTGDWSSGPHLHVHRNVNGKAAPVVLSGVEIKPTLNPAVYGKWPCNGTTYTSAGPVGGDPQPIGNGGAEIKSVQLGRCVDVSNASVALGSQVYLWDCDRRASQSWVYVDGQLKVYGNYSRCLDADGSGGSPAGNGRKVQIWECNGSAGQKWIPQADGSVKGFDGRCLDADGTGQSPAGNGRKVQLWDCNGSQGQKWISVAADWPNRDLQSATPRIGGIVKVGATLAVTPGAWEPAPVDLAYQWLRDGEVISGATASSYTLTADDAGKKISVKVTGSKAGYASVSKTSAEVLVAVPPKPSPTPKPTPTTTPSPSPKPSSSPSPSPSVTPKPSLAPSPGPSEEPLLPEVAVPSVGSSVKVGSKVSAKLGAWKSSYAVGYQWLLGGKAIKGATKSTYVPLPSDVGKRLSVRVTASAAGVESRTVTSKAVKVGKGSPSVKVSAKAGSRGKVKLSITLGLPGTKDASVSGKVKVYDGKKLVKTVTVKKGKASVGLSRLKKGSHTFKVSYSSTKAYEAKSGSVKVKVK